MASNGAAIGIRILQPAIVTVNPSSSLEAAFELENRGRISLAGGSVTAPLFVLGATGISAERHRCTAACSRPTPPPP